MRPRVKICGVTCAADVEAVLTAGADYVGVNFYPPSPRYVEPAAAGRLRRQIGDRATVVGVFVDAGVAEMQRIETEVGLDLLQLHGDEGSDVVAEFAGRAIKVFRVSDRFDSERLDVFESAWGFLFDSGVGGGVGGTGVPWHFEAVAGLKTPKPVFVAGGVGPANVADVCARCNPWGIDLCSSVESAPGRKDPALLQRLFEEIGDGEDSAT